MAKDSLLNIILNIVKQGSGDKDATSGMADLEKQLGDTTTSLIGSVVGFTTLSGAIYAGVAALKSCVDAAEQAQTVEAQLGATIESTGRSSGTSTPQIEALAQSMTGLFSRTDIETAANTLMRYMDIPTSQIPGDLALIENLAAGLGETLPQAADTLGNALETGRVRGLGFSREMTNEISLLATQGQTAQMDQLILDQLSEKYAGQYSAALDTYAGKQQELKSATDELKVGVGDGLLPVLEQLEDLETKEVQDWTGFGEFFGQMVSDLVVDVENMAKFGSATNPFANLSGWVSGGFTPQIDDAAARWKSLQHTLADTSGTDAATDGITTLDKALQSQDSWEQMYTNAKTAKDQTDDMLKMLGSDVQSITGEMGRDGTTVWDGFLTSTGKLSAAAINQFAMVQMAYNHIKDMLSQGISLSVVISYIQSFTGSGAAPYDKGEIDGSSSSSTSSSSSGGTIPAGEHWVPDPKNPGHYILGYAAGGQVAPNSILYNEDPTTRPETFVSGGGYMLTKQDAQAALGGAGGTINLYVNGAGDPASVAREVIRQLGATVNLQGARTRL